MMIALRRWAAGCAGQPRPPGGAESNRAAHRGEMNRGKQPSSGGRRYGGLAIAVVVLIAAVLAVFGQVAGHKFLIWDDEGHVAHNPRFNPVTWRSVGRFWTEESYWGLYIPLSYTFFGAEALIAQRPAPDRNGWTLNPSVFHLGNLGLHVLCVLLVFTILRRLVGHDGAACAGALLFALHPVQVESIAWISETRGVLCGVFSLLAIWQYLCYACPSPCRRRLQSPTEPAGSGSATGVASYNSPARGAADEGAAVSRRTRGHYVLATAAFLLALLSKPAAVAVPLIALVLELGLLRRPVRRVLLGLSPWLIVAAGWAIWTKRFQPDTLRPFVSPLWARPLVAGDALAFYLCKLVAPVGCGPDYGRSPEWVIGQWWFYVTWLLPAACVALLASLRNRRLWLTAAGVFVAWLLPALGLVPFDFQRISTVADRYLYLALLGPALALSWFLAHRWNRTTIGVTAAVLCVLGALSFVQTSHWRDNETLIAHGLRVNPRSVVARQHQGALLNREGALLDREGKHEEATRKYEEAIKWYRLALKDHPRHEEAYVSLAKSLVDLKRVDEAEKTLREALRHIPMRASIHCELANVLVKQATALANQGKELEAQRRLSDAEEHYREARRLDPQWVPAYWALGALLFDRGATDEAIRLYREALAVDPYSVEAHVNLGVALAKQGEVYEAMYHYREALRIRDDWPQAHFDLANLLRDQGAIDAAERHYRAALKYYPDYAKAHVELGIILFGRGATREAIRHYRAALRTDPKLVPAHVNLGHALAADGRPKEAAAAYRAALQLVPSDSKDAQRIREFLRPY